ncbi:hypothetical protein AMATHDRAFT_139377 [Amanita thiersii Skay4041]|uniref:Diphthine--ammonia ligase n=1 Tax=Amanita thiersii Skay4041 TaxID=703135 RepID=A0A2A9NPC2_9AGAR|nr:hypothetical protein AMATHDRAFT_139377 [Amanita thiersii Skay4041]
MKYLALLSGGKDSCYNLLHCHHNGHTLIAAASLGPAPGKEELDSYLYQTVGQDAIELVARALDVPLYRRVITGSAIEQGSEYGSRTCISTAVNGDETEDLYELLSSVKSEHPDIQGVSVGAILSNYQRVRVEHVCRRLGLTPLCYLWQRNQGSLLSEMIEAGLEAVIIKVAGIGLTVNHLGRTLAEMEPTLRKLNNLYGLHICGEGGEYETLTIDCPLFKHKIILEEVENVIHSDNAFATVAFLRMKKLQLTPKVPTTFTITVPPLLDDHVISLSTTSIDLTLPTQGKMRTIQAHPLVPASSVARGPWVSISNVQVTHNNRGSGLTIEEEVRECFAIAKDLLAQYGLDLLNCTIINCYISSMDLFAQVNAIYSTFFGSSPPARACVGVDLPESVNVRLDCLAFSGDSLGNRQALHVQGLSYWAPANIGPYSQAILADERVFISGQIGLIPSSLTLPSPRSMSFETALACQHVDRIAQAMGSSDWSGYTQGVIYWHSNAKTVVPLKQALKNQNPPNEPLAAIIFIVVKELPKDALVEKQVLLHTGRRLMYDSDDGSSSLRPCRPLFMEGMNEYPGKFYNGVFTVLQRYYSDQWK